MMVDDHELVLYLNTFQCVCFVIVLFGTACFVIRYYFAVLHKDSPGSRIGMTNKYKRYSMFNDPKLNQMLWLSCWISPSKTISDKKEISALMMSLICVLFCYVSVLCLTIGRILDSMTSIDVLLRLGIIISVISQFIFGFSIANNLVSILHNSIYQLSPKQIELMKSTNIAIIISFIPGIIFLTTDYHKSSMIAYIFIIVIAFPIFIISQAVFVTTVLRLYYIKVWKIINHLNVSVERSGGGINNNNNNNYNDVQLQAATAKAQEQLLDKLVQSMILNLSFVVLLIVEGSVYSYTNYIYNKSDEIFIVGTITMTIAMICLIVINWFQAGFNHDLYAKYCQWWHNCCLKCMRCCIYKNTSN